MMKGAATLMPSTIYLSLLGSLVVKLAIYTLLKSLPAADYLTIKTDGTELASQFQTSPFCHLPSLILSPRAIKSFMCVLTVTKDISFAEQKVNMWVEFVSCLKHDFLRTCIAALKKIPV